mgnify:CR=1 FL=1
MSTQRITIINDPSNDRKNQSRKQTLYQSLKTTIYMMRFVCRFTEGKIYTFLKILHSIYSILPKMIYIIFPGLIINEITNLKRENYLFIYLSVLVLTPIVDALISRSANSYFSKTNLRISNLLLKEYNIRTAMMDFESLENPELQILTERSLGTCYNALSVVDRLCSLLNSLIYLFAIFSIIASLNIVMVIVVLIVTFINSLITKRLNYIQYKNSQDLSKFDRYLNSLVVVLNDIHFAKEVRLFNLKEYFSNMLFEKRTEANKIKHSNAKSRLNSQILFSLSNFIQQIFMYIYLIYKTVYDSLKIGSMLIYMNAIGQFAGTFENLTKSYLEIAKNSLLIEEFKDFMKVPLRQYENGTLTPRIKKNSKLEFKNVSFKYPGSEIFALKKINLEINLNEKLCIVGANGSGKTTLIKLLTRLYFPTEGEILLDGVNINNFDYEKYQGLFSPVFQDYALYTLSIKENIALEQNPNAEKVKQTLKNVGLEHLIYDLSNGINTSIFKIHDSVGFEPSGGEGQRIAIARALYHTAQIYLLDEPTASLDPIAEYEIYKQFSDMIKNKPSILITHRLSAVKLVDKVLVMDNGKIAEIGTHQDLYNANGLYTKMYDVQAEYYKN